MRSLLVGLYLVIFLVFGLPVLAIEWLIAKVNPNVADKSQLWMVQHALRFVMFLSGVKLEVIGEENVPKDESVLYIGNHRSYFDIVITYARVPRLTGYIAKNSINKIPSLRIWMKRVHCLFLDRDDMRQGLQIILSAIDQMKQGISMCIFPEGTRCTDPDPTVMNTFKEGSFKVATKSGHKIVPMAITGTEHIFEDHLPWIKSSKVTLQYGKPIDPTALSKEEQKHIGAYTQKVIQQMLKEQAAKQQ